MLLHRNSFLLIWSAHWELDFKHDRCVGDYDKTIIVFFLLLALLQLVAFLAALSKVSMLFAGLSVGLCSIKGFKMNPICSLCTNGYIHMLIYWKTFPS